MFVQSTPKKEMIDDASSLAFLVSEDGKRFQQVATSGPVGFDEGSCIVGVVHPDVAELARGAAVHHVRANSLVNAITLLVKDVAPPTDDRSAELVTSFLASGAVASVIKSFRGDLSRWCYQLMKYILDQDRIACELRIVHKPFRNGYPLAADTTCDVILPHCGSESHLRLSTDSLRQQTLCCDIVMAIDQDHVSAAFLADISDQNNIRAYRLEPCRVGPDVARHVLSMRSHADFVAFQDSDDISLAHRLATLAAAAESAAAGIVGSHELQVHEVQEKVCAIRYPLDVNASLQRAGANHQLLLPTSIVRRRIVERVGGFSTIPSYHDVAFWLTASLSTKIINVDEFLYVRRRHPSSLTMRPDIGAGSPARRAVVARRRADFAAIVAGTLRVEDSTLAVRHRKDSIEFRDVKNGGGLTAAFGHQACRKTGV